MTNATVVSVQKSLAYLPGNPPVFSPAVTTQNSPSVITLETSCISNVDVHNPLLVVTASVSGSTGTGTSKVSDLIRSVTLMHSALPRATEIDGPALPFAGVAAAILDHRVGTKIDISELAVDPVIDGDGTFTAIYALPADLPAGKFTVLINMNQFVVSGFSAATYGARTAYLILPQEQTNDNSRYMMPRGQFKAAISTWTDTEHGVSPQTVVIGADNAILNNGSPVLIGSMTPTEIVNSVAYYNRALGGSNPEDVVVDKSGGYPSLKGVSNFSLAIFTWEYAN